MAEAMYQIWDTRKWFVSSEGHRIDQHIRESARGSWRPRSATARRSGARTRRLSGAVRHQGLGARRRARPEAHAARVADEARALLTAPQCPSGETTLILGGEQMALQIHESVGHAIELDRILGWEAAFAGTRWLDLAQLSPLRYGSELMNITIDPTIPGGAGSFGYDDEGTPARPRDAVRDGIWVGILAGRDSAAVAGLDYAGSVRADGWARLPMVRMTNVGLEPGPHTPGGDHRLDRRRRSTWRPTGPGRSTTSGSTSSSAARSARRSRTVSSAGCCATRPTRASGRGSGRRWTCSASEIAAWGTPNCGKGQPGQIGHTGHPAAAARFQNVRVGVRG